MKYRSHLLKVLPVLAASGALVTAMAPAGAQAAGPGALFVMTNSTDRARGNEVVMYERRQNGDLRHLGAFATGRLADADPQLGSGPAPTSSVLGIPVPLPADGLGSANSLILNQGNRCLFAVNAGSNSVSSFRVDSDGLRLRSVVSSQGELTARFPVSLTERNGILYVLNSGDQGSLTGFRVGGSCVLTAIPGSSRDLSGLTNSFLSPEPVEVGTAPAQALFSPDGKRLVLSIKGGPDGLGFLPSGRMAVFPVHSNGSLGTPVVTSFSFAQGRGGPFEFVFSDARTVIVTHSNSDSVGSYAINPDNTLSLLSGPFDTGALAPCWLDSNGRFVYTASLGGIPVAGTAPDGNGLLTGFRINDGILTPLNVSAEYPSPGTGKSGNHAIDIRIVAGFLYFVQPRTGMVGRFRIGNNGALLNPVNFGGLSPGVEPFAGLNPGITNFTEFCFLQDPATPSPECLRGSAQGIAGF
jgi:hypothetical protein